MGNHAGGDANGYGVLIEIGRDDCSDSHDSSVRYVDVADDFYAVGEADAMSERRIVEHVALNVMSQSHKDSDRKVAVDAYTTVRVYDNRAVVPNHKSRTDVCLPWNLKPVFDRIVS